MVLGMRGIFEIAVSKVPRLCLSFRSNVTFEVRRIKKHITENLFIARAWISNESERKDDVTRDNGCDTSHHSHVSIK
jgi:hypothetical protein